MTDPNIYTAEALTGLKGVRHGFFTRHGGTSGGIYDSNNCAFGSSDDPALVARNRDACIARLGLSSLTTVKQKHTPDVVIVETPWPHADAPVADALVTAKPGIGIGILTADCAPVLLADAERGIVAAAHAGWRGAFGGVLENTVAAMVKLGAKPEAIAAAVGPCIGQRSYEVGVEFVDRFIAVDAANSRYFTPTNANGKSHFDLPAYVRDRLARAGVTNVNAAAPDTCAAEDRYFSYRRSTLRNEPDYGRQLSIIGIAP